MASVLIGRTSNYKICKRNRDQIIRYTKLPALDELKGTITIEASIVIPIFIFAVFMLLSLINLFRFHMNMQQAIHQKAKKMAISAYDKWEPNIETIKNEIISEMEESVITYAPIRNGVSGIDFTKSDLDNREIIRLQAEYSAKLPYSPDGFFEYSFIAKSVIHTYIGYEHGLNNMGSISNVEEYVYITETGTVYHKNRNCSYLKLSIMESNINEVKILRNSYGHKYYPCESCGKRASGKVYITNDGERYHSSLGCSGLKRTVKCIPMSKVCGRRACLRCGR